jgi:hypothetical protein
MRNKDIGTDKVVPKALRRKIYTETIELIKTGKPVGKLSTFALCLTLPCVLWELDSFLNDTPQGKGWDQWDTSNMFPELTEERLQSITRIFNNQEERDNRRIRVLTEMLAEVQPIKKKK